MTILRYIGREHGLEADDKWDRAVGDELVTSWLDIFARTADGFMEPDKELKVRSRSPCQCRLRLSLHIVL